MSPLENEKSIPPEISIIGSSHPIQQEQIECILRRLIAKYEDIVSLHFYKAVLPEKSLLAI